MTPSVPSRGFQGHIQALSSMEKALWPQNRALSPVAAFDSSVSFVPSQSAPHSDGTHQLKPHHFFSSSPLHKASQDPQRSKSLAHIGQVSQLGTCFSILYTSQVCLPEPDVCPWESVFPSLNPSFLFWRAGIVTPRFLQLMRPSARSTLLSPLSASPPPKMNRFQRS